MTFAARCLNAALAPQAIITNQQALNYSLSGIGGTATATYRLDNTGVASATNYGGSLTAITGEWLTSGAAASFEAQATWGGGTGTTGGPTGWVALNVTRNWTLSATNNFGFQDLTVQIRNASSGIVLTTAVITFEVDAAP